MTEETVALCALNKIFGFSPHSGRSLVEMCGSGAAVFSLGREALEEITGPFNRFTGMIGKAALEESERELVALEKMGCRFTGWGEDGYPPLLRECDDAPVGLYMKGGFPAWNDLPLVAVVGTRDISPYGREWCRELIRAMASAGRKPLIVSGFALGTDIIAHQAALEFGLPTVAVLPTGIDDYYPHSHGRYVSALCSTPGCALLTDYPPGTNPVAVNFLRRNRIIAGMSAACVLVESKRKGGGMMTARLSFGYGRDVFALPGRVDDVRSLGCLQLIREKVAEPIDEVDAFIKNLGLGSTGRRKGDALAEELSARYSGADPGKATLFTTVALQVRKNRGLTPEELCELTGIALSDMLYTLGVLECDGIVCCDLLRRYCIRTSR